MPPGQRREYSGIAPPTTLSAGIGTGDVSVSITNGTGWPTGVIGPFYAVIDRGLPTEEKILFSARTGNVLTVATNGRGADGTAAASHSSGAAIEHVLAAADADQANLHYADAALDHHTQYLNTARHDVSERHTLAAIGYAGFSPGDFKMSAQAADHSGWLLCDGREVATATYPNLAFLGTTFGTAVAGNVKLPDFRGRAPIGAGPGTGLTNRAVGASFGAETVTLTTAHMPSHSHTINEHTHTFTSGVESTGHYHGLGGHTHGGAQHDHNIQHWHPAHIANVKYMAGTVAHNHGGGAGVTAEASSPNDGFGGTVAVNVESAANGAPNGLNRSGWIQNNGNTGGPTTGSDVSDRNHTHAGTTSGASNRGTDAQGSGTAMGIMNPHLAVNVFIKT